MSMTDPIADMLVRIRNAQMVGHQEAVGGFVLGLATDVGRRVFDRVRDGGSCVLGLVPERGSHFTGSISLADAGLAQDGWFFIVRVSCRVQRTGHDLAPGVGE